MDVCTVYLICQVSKNMYKVSIFVSKIKRLIQYSIRNPFQVCKRRCSWKNNLFVIPLYLGVQKGEFNSWPCDIK